MKRLCVSTKLRPDFNFALAGKICGQRWARWEMPLVEWGR